MNPPNQSGMMFNETLDKTGNIGYIIYITFKENYARQDR